MGKNDIYLKRYLSDKNRFADLFNNTVYGGKQILMPDNIQKISPSLEVVLKEQDGKKQGIRRYRDIMMKTKTGERIILLAVENQEEIHYAMPVRGMLYDALSYTEQVERMAKENRTEKTLKGAGEYLSGIRKDEKLYPVITLVLYYGSEEWDGSKDIHGLLNMDKNELAKISQYLPNYRINLIDAKELAQNNSFKTDLQWILGMLQYRENKEELKNFIHRNQAFFKNADSEAYEAARTLLGGKMLPPAAKKGAVNMCKALDDMYQEGVDLGEERLASLYDNLQKRNKIAELEKAMKDKAYRQMLYKEYNI